MSDDQDEPTIVIDFNSLKNDTSSDEVLSEGAADLLFKDELEVLEDSTTITDKNHFSENFEEEVFKKNIYFFDYKSEFFRKKFPLDKLEKNMKVITELNDLNKALRDDPSCILIFFYNEHPKVINQLSKQVKSKFSDAKTMIIAKKLSDQKAQQHKNSKYGADAYLSDPFETIMFYNTVKELY